MYKEIIKNKIIKNKNSIVFVYESIYSCCCLIYRQIYYYLHIYYLVLFGEYFLINKELPNTEESLIIQPSAASVGVSITE